MNVGDRVRAKGRITEGGKGWIGITTDCLPSRSYIHAERGQEGEVVHVTEDGLATVRFFPTGTATIVSNDEVEVVKP